nr:gamma-interferon-inducible lysosomal thiol reductase-like isoform X2 [Cherax quadricarinatus]
MAPKKAPSAKPVGTGVPRRIHEEGASSLQYGHTSGYRELQNNTARPHEEVQPPTHHLHKEVQSTAHHLNKVKVSVMFTSACRVSRWFINHYVYPTMVLLGHYVNLELIPYGILQQDGGCQFGQGDCVGNWLVSCGSRHMKGGQVAHLAFTTCVTHHIHILKSNFSHLLMAAHKCISEAGRVEQVAGDVEQVAGRVEQVSGEVEQVAGEWQDVYECVRSGEGYQLFLEAGRRQHQLAPTLTQVPAVAISQVLVLENKTDLGSFSKTLCQSLANLTLDPRASLFCQQATSQDDPSTAMLMY